MPVPSLPPDGAAAARQMMLYDANRKSVGVAFLLWVFFGMVGGHRFYAGKTGSAVAMLVLFILGWVLFLAVIGIFILGIVGIWALIDAFLIPGWISDYNTALAHKYAT